MKFVRFIVCGIIFILMGYSIEFLTVDDANMESRVVINEMYEQQENIDILILGSSHAYHSFDPYILSASLGKNVFVAGTSAQELDGTLILLQEADKENEIEAVVLELYYSMAMEPRYKERTELTSTYLISDYLRNPLVKTKYLLSASGYEHYGNSFFPARRNWENLLEVDTVISILDKKLTPEYLNYKFAKDSTTSYAGKGYFPVDEKIEDGCFVYPYHTPAINTDNISEDWMNSLYEIIEYCKQQDIELTLVSTPIQTAILQDMGNYDVYVSYVNELVQEYGIEYYDFNLIHPQYFPVNTELFYDDDHINKDGAEIFSYLLGELLKKNIEKKEVFANTFLEKYEVLEEKIFGLIVSNDVANSRIVIEPITNIDVNDLNIELIVYSNGRKACYYQGIEAGIPIEYSCGQEAYGVINVIRDKKNIACVTVNF